MKIVDFKPFFKSDCIVSNTDLTQMSKILSPFSGGVSGEGDFVIFGVSYIPYHMRLKGIGNSLSRTDFLIWKDMLYCPYGKPQSRAQAFNLLDCICFDPSPRSQSSP